jgi:hypothetical protein
MRRIFLFLLLTIVISCHDISTNQNESQFSEGTKTVQIQLIDSLGIVTVSLPLRYDTNFSWVHFSDCGKPCDERKYRFQSKGLPALQESGWIWSEPTDSVERMTISHVMDFPFHEGDTSKNVIRHKHIKGQLMFNPKNPPIVFDTVQKINDRYYSIFVMEKADSMQSKKVLAVTTIKSNEIRFLYELLTQKNDSISKEFIKNSLDLIKSIRISKGV